MPNESDTKVEAEAPPRNIHQRMLAVMQAVDYVVKEKKLVNNQYRFVSHDAVVAAIRPHLVDNGIATEVNVEEHSQDGNRTEANVSVAFINVDRPEDKVICNGFGYGIDSQDKGPGKAISYAVKYVFLKTFCLETGDDPERDTKTDYKPAEPKVEEDGDGLERKALYQEIKAAMQLHNVTKPELTKFLGKDAPDMDIEELREVPKRIEKQFADAPPGQRNKPPAPSPEPASPGPESEPEIVDVSKVDIKDVSNHDLTLALGHYAKALGMTRAEVDEMCEIEYSKAVAKLNKLQLRNFVLLVKQLAERQMSAPA